MSGTPASLHHSAKLTRPIWLPENRTAAYIRLHVRLLTIQS